MRIPLACLFVIAVVACGGDDTSDTDAGIDAPVVVPDAPVVVPDAPVVVPDAPVVVPDAPVVVPDAGGVLSIPTVCMHACDTILACTGMPANPECNVGCEADLIDCSAEQLRQIDACAGTVCPPGNPETVMLCLMAVGCVDM